MGFGRIALGIKTPIITNGSDLFSIVIDSISSTLSIQSGDIIGITESVVARSQGLYVTLDEITEEVKSLNFKNLPIRLWNPIYSRNRFSMILKAIARATSSIEIIMPPFDEVGNPAETNPFTGVNIKDYYTEICTKENCKVTILSKVQYDSVNKHFNIDCHLRPSGNFVSLKNICSSKSEYGLLGSNKASEEKLKLFPNGQDLVNKIQDYYHYRNLDVEVLIFGDGCFKDPIGGIWEFADPITSPAYTSGLKGTPNEIKIKAFADDKYSNLSGSSLDEAIKQEIKSKPSNLINNMSSQGTTPRRKIDLLVSLMDLISGSGDAGTPIVVVRNYGKSFAD